MSDGRDDGDALRHSDARFRLAVETLGEGADPELAAVPVARYRPVAAPAVPAKT